MAASVMTINWNLSAELDFILAHFDYFKQVLTKHSLQISRINQFLHVVRCMIWYHSYNLKNVKNTHEGCYL